MSCLQIGLRIAASSSRLVSRRHRAACAHHGPTDHLVANTLERVQLRPIRNGARLPLWTFPDQLSMQAQRLLWWSERARHAEDFRCGSFASILACPRHVRLAGSLGNACPVLPVAPTSDATRESWIRRGLDQGACPPAKSMGEHSAETKSQRPYLLRPVSVSRAKLDRTVLNKIKQCRRVATRYDKLAVNYLAFIRLASIRIWLRANESTP